MNSRGTDGPATPSTSSGDLGRRKLLVLGGGVFVGRAVVEEGVADGWEVTTFSDDPQAPVAGVRHVVGDRRRTGDVAPLAEESWNLVVDTWRGDPKVVRSSVDLVGPRAHVYAYISSLTVYDPRQAAPWREDALLAPVDPRPPLSYAARKRLAEIEVLKTRGSGALLVRPGVVLGPHEYSGRLTGWLARLATHSATIAPGRPARPFQYVDARDLARWVLRAGRHGVSGPFNLCTPPGGTFADLLRACLEATESHCHVIWTPDRTLTAAGLHPWRDIPLWVPEQDGVPSVYDVDATAAQEAGARFRPLADTVADTWSWLGGLDPAEHAFVTGRSLWPTREQGARLVDCPVRSPN